MIAEYRVPGPSEVLIDVGNEYPTARVPMVHGKASLA